MVWGGERAQPAAAVSPGDPIAATRESGYLSKKLLFFFFSPEKNKNIIVIIQREEGMPADAKEGDFFFVYVIARSAPK